MSDVDASLQRHLDWLYGPGGVYETAGDGPCRCEYGWQSLGRLYGVAMGKGWVRTTTHPHCPHHGTKADAPLPKGLPMTPRRRTMAAEPRPHRCTLTGDCPDRARWLVFSAYDDNPNAIHPTVSRYPAPMHAVCDTHLPVVMDRDGDAPLSTAQYVVKPDPKRGTPDDT